MGSFGELIAKRRGLLFLSSRFDLAAASCGLFRLIKIIAVFS